MEESSARCGRQAGSVQIKTEKGCVRSRWAALAYLGGGSTVVFIAEGSTTPERETQCAVLVRRDRDAAAKALSARVAAVQRRSGRRQVRRAHARSREARAGGWWWRTGGRFKLLVTSGCGSNFLAKARKEGGLHGTHANAWTLGLWSWVLALAV